MSAVMGAGATAPESSPMPVLLVYKTPRGRARLSHRLVRERAPLTYSLSRALNRYKALTTRISAHGGPVVSGGVTSLLPPAVPTMELMGVH